MSFQSSHRQSEQGVALFTVLILLLVLTMLGISGMRMNIMQERIAANAQEVNRAFQAAESGVVRAFSGNNVNNLPTDLNNTGPNNATPLVTVTLGQGTPVQSTAQFSTWLRERTAPSRSSAAAQIFGQGRAQKYHWNIQSTGTSTSGATAQINAGFYRIGPG